MPTPEQLKQTALKTQKLILEMEKRRGSRIFSIIHNDEDDAIAGETLRTLMTHRSHVQHGGTIDILLHSFGGNPDVAYKIVKFLRRRCARLNVIVPLYAKSAATLMCLGADEILMGEFSELGPVDIQITDPLRRGAQPFSPLDEFKCMEYMRDYSVEILDFFTALFLKRSGMSVKEAMEETIPCIIGLMRPLLEQIDPLEMGEHRRSLAIGEEYAKRLLAMTKNPNLKAIVQRLVWKYPSHEFSIDYDEALELKLPVKLLDRRDEDALVSVLEECIDHEISICGFIHPGKARKIKKAKASPKKTVPRKPPAKKHVPGPVIAAVGT